MTQQTDELNRLMRLGLSPPTAIAVLNGEVDEAHAIAAQAEADEARRWVRRRTNRELLLTAFWDTSPDRFHLALDGVTPGELVDDPIELMEAEISDIVDCLTHGATRDADPWHASYRDKSGRIAYRWFKERPVTPPLFVPWSAEEISIAGGMHRFHLARHYRVKCIPILFYRRDRDTIAQLLRHGA